MKILNRANSLIQARQVSKLVDRSWGCGDIRATDAHPFAGHLKVNELTAARHCSRIDLDQFEGDNPAELAADAMKRARSHYKDHTRFSLVGMCGVAGLFGGMLAGLPILAAGAAAVTLVGLVGSVISINKAREAADVSTLFRGLDRVQGAATDLRESQGVSPFDQTHQRMEYYLSNERS